MDARNLSGRLYCGLGRIASAQRLNFTPFDAPGASTDGYGTFGIGLNEAGVTVGYYTNSNFNYGGSFVARTVGLRPSDTEKRVPQAILTAVKVQGWKQSTRLG